MAKSGSPPKPTPVQPADTNDDDDQVMADATTGSAVSTVTPAQSGAMKDLLNHIYTRWVDAEHDHAKVFHRMVNRRLVPTYYDLIAEPVALSSIRAKINTDEYLSFGQFVRDFALIGHNAQLFNRRGSDVFEDGVAVWNEVAAFLRNLGDQNVISAEQAVMPDLGEIPDDEDEEDEDDDDDDDDDEDEDDDDDDDSNTADSDANSDMGRPKKSRQAPGPTGPAAVASSRPRQQNQAQPAAGAGGSSSGSFSVPGSVMSSVGSGSGISHLQHLRNMQPHLQPQITPSQSVGSSSSSVSARQPGPFQPIVAGPPMPGRGSGPPGQIPAMAGRGRPNQPIQPMHPHHPTTPHAPGPMAVPMGGPMPNPLPISYQMQQTGYGQTPQMNRVAIPAMPSPQHGPQPHATPLGHTGRPGPPTPSHQHGPIPIQHQFVAHNPPGPGHPIHPSGPPIAGPGAGVGAGAGGGGGPPIPQLVGVLPPANPSAFVLPVDQDELIPTAVREAYARGPDGRVLFFTTPPAVVGAEDESTFAAGLVGSADGDVVWGLRSGERLRGHSVEFLARKRDRLKAQTRV